MINKSIVLFVPNGLTFCKNSVIVKYTDEFNDLMRTQKSIRYYLNSGYQENNIFDYLVYHSLTLISRIDLLISHKLSEK